MVSIVKRNGVRLLSVLFILVILMGIVFVASTTNVFGLSYASEGVLKSDAKDAVTYSNQHDEENEELSLANVSSATASFLNWATFMAIKPDSPNQKMLDMIAGSDSKYVKNPAMAGAYVGYVKNAHGEEDSIFAYAMTRITKASMAYSYKLLRSASAERNRPDLYGYAIYGSALKQLGLDKYGLANSTDYFSAVWGLIILGAYVLAASVPKFFGWIIDALQFINPFGLLTKSSQINSGTGDMSLTRTFSGSHHVHDAFNSFQEFYGGLIDVLARIGWYIVIPACIVILVAGFLLFRNVAASKARAKKLFIRIVVLAIGIPFLGIMYTTLLDEMKEAVNTPATAPDVMVASTLIDFSGWAMNSNLSVPNDNSQLDGAIEVMIKDIGSGRVEPTSISYWNLKSIALWVNKNCTTYLSNLEFDGDSYGFAKDVTDTTNSVSTWTMSSLDPESSGNNGFINGGIVLLITQYMGGSTISSGAFASMVSSEHTNDSVLAVMIRNMDTLEEWQDQFKNWDGSDNRITPFLKSQHPGDGLGSFMNNGGLEIANINGTGASSSELIGYHFYQSDSSSIRNKSERIGLGLSDLAMYNYLNSEFKDTELIANSPADTVSLFSQSYHKSVNLIGTGFLAFCFYLHLVVTLWCYAIIGWLYGFGMLFQNFKRLFSLLTKIPAAALGVIRSMAQVVAYSIAMMLEVLVTIFLYTVVMKLLVVIPNVIMSSVSALAASQTDSSYFWLVVCLLILTVIIIVFSVSAIKSRKKIIKGIDEGINGLLARIFGTDNVMKPDAPKSHPVRNAVMAGAGYAAANRMLGGGGEDGNKGDNGDNVVGSSLPDNPDEGENADGNGMDENGNDDGTGGSADSPDIDGNNRARLEDSAGRNVAQQNSLSEGSQDGGVDSQMNETNSSVDNSSTSVNGTSSQEFNDGGSGGSNAVRAGDAARTGAAVTAGSGGAAAQASPDDARALSAHNAALKKAKAAYASAIASGESPAAAQAAGDKAYDAELAAQGTNRAGVKGALAAEASRASSQTSASRASGQTKNVKGDTTTERKQNTVRVEESTNEVSTPQSGGTSQRKNNKSVKSVQAQGGQTTVNYKNKTIGVQQNVQTGGLPISGQNPVAPVRGGQRNVNAQGGQTTVNYKNRTVGVQKNEQTSFIGPKTGQIPQQQRGNRFVNAPASEIHVNYRNNVVGHQTNNVRTSGQSRYIPSNGGRVDHVNVSGDDTYVESHDNIYERRTRRARQEANKKPSLGKGPRSSDDKI